VRKVVEPASASGTELVVVAELLGHAPPMGFAVELRHQAQREKHDLGHQGHPSNHPVSRCSCNSQAASAPRSYCGTWTQRRLELVDERHMVEAGDRDVLWEALRGP
jgi:hypothetical protein